MCEVFGMGLTGQQTIYARSYLSSKCLRHTDPHQFPVYHCILEFREFRAQSKYTNLIKIFEKNITLGEDRSVIISPLLLCRSGTTPTKESFIPLSTSTLNTKESRQGIKQYHVSHYFLLKPVQCSETVMHVIWVCFRK